MGEMADMDVYDASDEYRYEAEPTRCRRCRAETVYWAKIGKRYVMHDTRTGEPHRCDVARDFRVLR